MTSVVNNKRSNDVATEIMITNTGEICNDAMITSKTKFEPNLYVKQSQLGEIVGWESAGVDFDRDRSRLRIPRSRAGC